MSFTLLPSSVRAHFALYPHCITHPSGQPYDCPDGNPLQSDPDHHVVEIRNNSYSPVIIRFFDRTDGGYWGSYSLYANEEESWNLSCEVGNQVCYGALNQFSGGYYGVSLDNDKGCRNCCFTCQHGGFSIWSLD